MGKTNHSFLIFGVSKIIGVATKNILFIFWSLIFYAYLVLLQFPIQQNRPKKLFTFAFVEIRLN